MILRTLPEQTPASTSRFESHMCGERQGRAGSALASFDETRNSESTELFNAPSGVFMSCATHAATRSSDSALSAASARDCDVCYPCIAFTSSRVD